MTAIKEAYSSMFAAELVTELEEIRARFPYPKAAMVPVLRRLQTEKGWLDKETQAWVAEFLSVNAIEVHEVVTFYPMLYADPVGKHVVHVCRTLSCEVCGGKELWRHLEKKLGVTRGETSADGKFTLRAAECLASCGTAPVMLIDNVRHEHVGPEEADKLLGGVG
ncbi:MAG: NADH-quinone oxidoreductase subunit NuoE [Planctomycetota bacterium]|nr:NADH-quinone oxidoreductase subunit NuoE [Planctomycetota bacterium]